jgi:hypothetical protein
MAAARFPDSFERAFRWLCDLARFYVSTRRFRTWATDFRRREDADILRALAELDVDDFLLDAPPPMTSHHIAELVHV